MANPWPKSTKAVRKQEASNWELGDALIEECPASESGVNNNSLGKIKDFTDFLFSSYGIIRAPSTLRDVRDLCLVFPAEGASRDAPLDWSIYRVFRGCPDLLGDWIKDHEDETMTVKAATEMVAAHKKSLEAAATRGEEDEEETASAEEPKDEETKDEETKDEETSETDKENSEEETQPLAAKDEEIEDGQASGEDAASEITEEEGEPEPETAEEAEMRLSAEKRAKEEAARCKTEDLITVTREIGRFVQGNTDISIAWNREAQENIKDALKDLNWIMKQLKSREKGLAGTTASEKPARRSRSKPNGAEEQQSALIH